MAGKKVNVQPNVCVVKKCHRIKPIPIYLGQGLGKSQDGMSVPLKANLKFDQAGLGHSKSDELNNHWWERVYNSAAQNFDVNKSHDDDEVSMQVKDGKSIEVHTTKL